MMTDRATNTSFYIYHYLFLVIGSVSEQRCGSWESFFPHWCVWLVAYYSPCSAVDVVAADCSSARSFLRNSTVTPLCSAEYHTPSYNHSLLNSIRQSHYDISYDYHPSYIPVSIIMKRMRTMLCTEQEEWTDLTLSTSTPSVQRVSSWILRYRL